MHSFIYTGYCSGRKIVGIHLAILLTVFAIEIYILKSALSAVQQYQITNQELESNPSDPPAFVVYEDFISNKFNEFFFGAASECNRKYITSSRLVS